MNTCKITSEPKLIHKNDNQTLKEMRLLRGLTRREAGQLFNTSETTIKRRESSQYPLKSGELDKIIEGYGFTKLDFLNIKVSKIEQIESLKPIKKIKIIEHNELRRSYKKIITKETFALTMLRQRKGLNKYEASKLCEYHRSTIGNIENGRITLTKKKLQHVLKCYGVSVKEFNSIVESKIDRIATEKKCFQQLQKLSDEKLITVQNLLKNL